MYRAHFGGTHCERPSQTESLTAFTNAIKCSETIGGCTDATYPVSLIGSRHWATTVQFRASARADMIKSRRVGEQSCDEKDSEGISTEKRDERRRRPDFQPFGRPRLPVSA